LFGAQFDANITRCAVQRNTDKPNIIQVWNWFHYAVMGQVNWIRLDNDISPLPKTKQNNKTTQPPTQTNYKHNKQQKLKKTSA